MIEPHLLKLEKFYNGEVSFYEIDVEENGNLASKYDIVNIPTLLIFKDGKVIGLNCRSTSF